MKVDPRFIDWSKAGGADAPVSGLAYDSETDELIKNAGTENEERMSISPSRGGISVKSDISSMAEGQTIALDPSEGSMTIVPELGMFRYDADSTEPVDGETCLASTDGVGRWLIAMPDAGWVYQLFDRVKALETRKSPEILTASRYQTFSSLAAGATTQVLIDVPGAVPGDIVVVGSPNGYVGYSNISSYKALVINAAVAVDDIAIVRITNLNSAAVTPPSGYWEVMVMKEVQK